MSADRLGQLTAWLEDNPGPWPWEQMSAWIDWVNEDMDPAFRRAAERYWEREQQLAYFKAHGIEQGMQWSVLGYLACRYARDFTTDELAHELWEIVQASGQNPRDPWQWHQIRSCAARAKRFIDRADALADTRLRNSGALAWALAASRAAQASRPWAAGTGRRGRMPGARRPGVRA
jgi:hypothetical protein